MNVLDLFSGIGGFSLGLERAGMTTVAFCEIDPYCRKVLSRHWPKVPIYDDVRNLTADRLATDGIAVDIICGGFPCQDISIAGKGTGMAGARSGLWSEYARLVGELRPRYVLVENVATLLLRGLERVLGDLAALGYDADWNCIPASAVGAPHRRDRVWIVAYPHGGQRNGTHELLRSGRDAINSGGFAGILATARRHEPILADASPSGLQISEREVLCGARWREEGRAASQCGWWSTEPDVGRVAHGVPARVDRLRALGNAVIPQIPEIIGRAIMTREA